MRDEELDKLLKELKDCDPCPERVRESILRALKEECDKNDTQERGE